jgi:hypothetical protein
MNQKFYYMVNVSLCLCCLFFFSAGCSSTRLERFTPSVSYLEKDGFNLRVMIRGNREGVHIPFLYMRREGSGPYDLHF